MRVGEGVPKTCQVFYLTCTCPFITSGHHPTAQFRQRLGKTVHEYFTNARTRETPIREFVVSFVDGDLTVHEHG